MTDLASEIRAETARIIKRHFGSVPDAIGAIRLSTVEKISAYVDAAEDRAASCVCQPASAYQIPVRRYSRPLDAQFTLERLKRMRAVDEAVEAVL